MEEQLQNSENIKNEKSLKIANYCVYIAVWVWCIWVLITLYNELSNLETYNIYECIWNFVINSLLIYLIFKKNRIASLFFFVIIAHNSLYQFANTWSIGIFNIIALITTFIWVIWCFKHHSLIWKKKFSILGILMIILLIIWSIFATIWILSQSWIISEDDLVKFFEIFLN
jgi:hypothetical protein